MNLPVIIVLFSVLIGLYSCNTAENKTSEKSESILVPVDSTNKSEDLTDSVTDPTVKILDDLRTILTRKKLIREDQMLMIDSYDSVKNCYLISAADNFTDRASFRDWWEYCPRAGAVTNMTTFEMVK